MSKNTIIGIVVALVVVGGGAYWAFAGQPMPITSQMPITSGEGAPEGSIHNMPAEPAAEAARADLAAKLGISPSSITILLVEERTWSDGCLGLGGPAESCLQALTNGFNVVLLAQGKSYVYRTDQTGSQVRAE